MGALAALFDDLRVLVPVAPSGPSAGEVPLGSPGVTVVPLTVLHSQGWRRKLGFPFWVLRNLSTMVSEFCRSDAVHAPIPGDVGTVGMLLAWLFRKRLLVRHCGNWLKPVTFAEKFWRGFMEATAGGRKVMLATGGAAEPPSARNSNVHWIFSSSLTEKELGRYGAPRSCPADGRLALAIVARQERAKGAGTVIRSLALLRRQFPQVKLEIVGEGSAIPEFKRMAVAEGVGDRVDFAGKLNHEQVLHRLQAADLFVFPTTSSDGFPKAVLEALATGLPVVATRVSVLPQLLGTGCGVLIDEATPEAVARGIEQALSSAACYEGMSRRAIETACHYSLEAWRDAIGALLTKAWGPLRGEGMGRGAGGREQGAGIGNRESEVGGRR